MADDRFEALAMKVLTGEASREEASELAIWLERDAQRRDQFQELELARDVLREFGPLVRAMDAPHTPVPSHRLGPLLGAVRANRAEPEALSLLEWLCQWLNSHGWLTAAVATAVVVGLFVVAQIVRTPPRAGTPATVAGGPKAGSLKSAAEVDRLLGLPLPQFLATIPGPVPAARTRSAEHTFVYSPVGFTLSLQPTIHWRAEPGRRYDVTIKAVSSVGSAPWQTNGVVPPLDFSTMDGWKDRPLQRGAHYELTIRESGRAVSLFDLEQQTFQVATNAAVARDGTALARLERARQSLLTEPVCAGDALGELATLPPEIANTESALRLKAIALGSLAFQEEYTNTIAQLSRLIRSAQP